MKAVKQPGKARKAGIELQEPLILYNLWYYKRPRDMGLENASITETNYGFILYTKCINESFCCKLYETLEGAKAYFFDFYLPAGMDEDIHKKYWSNSLTQHFENAGIQAGIFQPRGGSLEKGQ